MSQHTKILSCNVILLPTEDYSPFVMSNSSYGGLLLTKYYGSAWTHMGDKYQHLYLTVEKEISEREIKVGDWVIATEGFCKTFDINVNDKIVKITEDHQAEVAKLLGCSKIVATTDSVLGLPTIKDQDLLWYSRQTNDGKDIKSVNIELQKVYQDDPFLLNQDIIKTDTENNINILHFSLENKSKTHDTTSI